MPVRVLIAEDNPATREALIRELESRQGIQLIGAARNGIEALHLIRQRSPQVLVCDMVMPQLDGFGVLEEMTRMKATQKPRVIALTALSRDDFIMRALELGVAYYMVKPADMNFLAQRIMALAGKLLPARQAETPQEKASAEQNIAAMLLKMGVPVHLNGYRFLLRATLLVLEHPDYLGNITHALYPAVASHFSTTASCVERSIRHAISMTWARGGASAFETVLNRRTFTADDRPTNCELISLLCEQARLHGWTNV